jgi:hypothetical protein
MKIVSSFQGASALYVRSQCIIVQCGGYAGQNQKSRITANCARVYHRPKSAVQLQQMAAV